MAWVSNRVAVSTLPLEGRDSLLNLMSRVILHMKCKKEF
jgi:hypothetical protein